MDYKALRNGLNVLSGLLTSFASIIPVGSEPTQATQPERKLYSEPTDQEINENIDTTDSSVLCITCQHRRRRTVFVPCGHSLLCTVCSKTLVTTCDELKCPVCRKVFDKIQKIYN